MTQIVAVGDVDRGDGLGDVDRLGAVGSRLDVVDRWTAGGVVRGGRLDGLGWTWTVGVDGFEAGPARDRWRGIGATLLQIYPNSY